MQEAAEQLLSMNDGVPTTVTIFKGAGFEDSQVKASLRAAAVYARENGDDSIRIELVVHSPDGDEAVTGKMRDMIIEIA